MNAVAHWDANGAPLDFEFGESSIIEQPELTHEQNVAYIAHELAKLPQKPAPVTHRFAPGVYLREIFMEADSIVIGRIHKTEHFNVLLKGACLIVHDDGHRETLRAPLTFISKAGVQKVLYVLEDTIWQTIHPTTETCFETLDAMLVEPVSAEIVELLK